MAGRRQHVLATLTGAVLVGVVALTQVDSGATAVETTAGTSGQLHIELAAEVALPAPAPAYTVPETIASTVPLVSTTVAPPLPTTAPAKPAAAPRTPMTVPPQTVVTPTTLAPATVTAPTTTVVACRNSTDAACGAFRFEPQPGTDRPMTVEVVAERAPVGVDGEIVFTLTLNDPDRVSYGSSLFDYGDSGSGDSSVEMWKKFGAWDPPRREAAHATEVLRIRHTYASSGTYTASFAFDAGPFDCVDSVTGRGDRPYASSATGTVTVVLA